MHKPLNKTGFIEVILLVLRQPNILLAAALQGQSDLLCNFSAAHRQNNNNTQVLLWLLYSWLIMSDWFMSQESKKAASWVVPCLSKLHCQWNVRTLDHDDSVFKVHHGLIDAHHESLHHYNIEKIIRRRGRL